MIFDAMKLIRDGLQQYILDAEQSDSNQEIVILENIAMAQDLGGSGDNQNERVVMSLVNLQEEVTLKNSGYQRLENGRSVYRNPPTFLNLFILFSVLNNEKYETSLKRLSRVIEFFQWKKELLLTTTPSLNNPPQDVQVFMDLFSLTFEQQNYLWGSLGGKQVPFVLYRARLVTLSAGKIQAESQPVTEIYINTNR
jgi:Pvc16 N-terminal domain